jgi:DNA-directed RNA polymerase specialized sigma24 family protein
MLAAVIEHRIVDMIRSKSREQKMMYKFQDLRETNVDSVDGHTLATDLPIDVLAAIEHLSPVEKKVCMLLMEGKTIPSIAKQLNSTWHEVRLIVRHIRHQFASHKLGQYLGGRINE